MRDDGRGDGRVEAERVPCWKLRRAHALLLAKGYGTRMEVASAYLAVICRATAARG